ncbi:MAG: glycosyltransferase, partial [Candidatus Heimdallarchaeota archaeon]|nr:glycosyltransferase [Candidatus Heimdallarchaeota archaeon]
MRQVSIFIVPSKTVGLQLADFGFSSVLVLPGIDARKIEETEAPRQRDPTVISIGRLVPHKSFARVISACALITPSPKIDIIGIGECKEELTADAAARKLDCTIHNVNDAEKFKLLKKSGVFLACSEYEGFGAPVAEAMACGVPVIANKIPVFTELYTDHILYYQDDASLASLIVKLLSDRDFYTSRIKLQSALVSTYSMEEAAKRLQDLFLEISGKLIKNRLAFMIRNVPDSCKEVYEEEAQRNWDTSAYLFNPHWLRHWRVDFALAELKGYYVLDMGCAYGAYSIRFAEKGFHVTAFDVSEFYLKKVRELSEKFNVKDLINTKQGNAHNLPFSVRRFDSIWIGELLEHVPNPADLIKEALRVVKPGGVIVFSTPYKDHHYDPLHLHIWKELEHFRSAVLDKFKDEIVIKKLDLIAEGELAP